MNKYYFLVVVSVLSLLSCSDGSTDLEAKYLGQWRSNCIAAGSSFSATTYKFSLQEGEYILGQETKLYDDSKCTVQSAISVVGNGPGPFSIGAQLADQGGKPVFELNFQEYSFFGPGGYIDRYDIISLSTDDAGNETIYFGTQVGNQIEDRPVNLDLERVYRKVVN